MKIIIAGAGIGGLYSAYLFGKAGHSVVVYERTDCLENMRYDWHDDINPYDFANLGLTMPKESFPKKNWTFISPKGYAMPMTQSKENTDFSVERRSLNKCLFDLASQYAEIVFGRTVAGAVTAEGKVCGVLFEDGNKESCDLVIDACGVDSKVRKSLPVTFGIGDVDNKDVFVAYRAIFDAVEGAEVLYTDKVYMKHCGEKGISWCIVDDDPSKIDVLIGRVGELSKETLDAALESLRKDNPVLGKNLIRGGIVNKIPVRRPLDVFVADGYAAIGDSTCMTIPLIGSGIISSLYAAKYLFEAVGGEKNATVEKLWQYEVSVYKDFGARHCGVEYIKNFLLKMDNADIDMIFKRKILSNSDMQNLSVGKLITLTTKDVLTKAKKAGLHAAKLIPLASMLAKTQKIKSIAEEIPVTYDEIAVAKWANKLDKACEQ